MTREEALAWLDEAEANPDQIDPSEAREVYNVLFQAAGRGTDPNVVRANAILQSLGLRPTVGQGQFTTSTGERVAAPEIDNEFTTRFFEAAQTAGVSREEARSILDTTLQQVAEFGGDPAALLLPLVTDWEGQAAVRTPIGVPADFVAQREIAISRLTGRSDVRDVEPRYFDGDQYSPAGLSPEEITRIQKRLENAGLLMPGSYYPGLWDSTTALQYAEVLATANRRGSTADDALDFMVANPSEAAIEARNRARLEDQFQAPAFLEPDYATLAQGAKSYMRGKLGREPTDGEMAELTGAMSGAYRADYEAEVAAMRSEFEARQTGLETGEVVTPATVADVDPQARFGEFFDRRFGPELTFVEDQADRVRNAGNIYASLRTMTGLVG